MNADQRKILMTNQQALINFIKKLKTFENKPTSAHLLRAQSMANLAKLIIHNPTGNVARRFTNQPPASSSAKASHLVPFASLVSDSASSSVTSQRDSLFNVQEGSYSSISAQSSSSQATYHSQSAAAKSESHDDPANQKPSFFHRLFTKLMH